MQKIVATILNKSTIDQKSELVFGGFDFSFFLFSYLRVAFKKRVQARLRCRFNCDRLRAILLLNIPRSRKLNQDHAKGCYSASIRSKRQKLKLKEKNPTV